MKISKTAILAVITRKWKRNIKYIVRMSNKINWCSDCVLLQHVSVLGDHHQAIVLNEANTVIQLLQTYYCHIFMF
jgi:hypothetical protein